MSKIMKFLKGEEGVTALEYSLIAALIAAFIIGAVTLAGQSVESVFNDIAGAIGGVAPPPPAP